jgi:heterodisulfide reductase subunit A
VLGGLANQLDEIFPDLACAACFMEPVLDEVLHAERIEVLTGAELARVRGGEGRFTVELALRPRRVDPAACMGCGACSAVCPVERPDPLAGGLGTRRAIGLAYAGCLPHVSAVEEGCLHVAGGTCDACATACPFGAPRLDEAPAVRELQVGAIVVATGLSPGAVTGPDGLVSSYQLERMLHPDGPTAGRLGAGGQPPRAVLLATTAAEEDGAVAVEEILKLAHRVKVKAPEARVMVVGGLHEAPGLARRSAALRAEGVELLPARLVGGAVSATPAGGLAIRVAHAGVESVLEADLVVVHAASVPAQGSDGLAALLRLERDGRGFLLDRPPSPFEPTATRTPGVYVAGAAAGPRTIREAIRDGAAAAGRVLATLVPGETRSLEPLAAEVDASTCGGCAVCVAVCPFGAVALAEGDGKAHVDPVHCRGCGSCAAACPTGAASARHFTRAQIAAEISALLAT